MSNPYLVRLRERYDGIRSGIEGLQTRAAEEGRDLTPDELRSIEGQAQDAKGLASQIESLTEIETRNRQVGEMAASIATPADTDVRTVGASSTVARDRDPGHYRSVQEGGQHSFFGDIYRSSQLRDQSAAARLSEHSRAIDSADGVGIIPPKWMSDEFAELARQGRRVADVVRHLPISDNRPIPLGKQTAGTDASVAEMDAETDTTTFGETYATDKDTLTPRVTSGGQKFRRELLDSSSPAIDTLVYGDLLAVYNAKVEAKVMAAIFAAGPAALTYNPAAANTADVEHATRIALKAGLEVRDNRKLPATGLVMGVPTYGLFLDAVDSTGRPVMPAPQPGAAVNVFGVGTVQVDGIVQNLPVFASDGTPTANVADFAAVRLSDVILAESPTLRFYDELTGGPEEIRIAVWGYTGVLVRYSATAVQKVTPEAAG